MHSAGDSAKAHWHARTLFCAAAPHRMNTTPLRRFDMQEMASSVKLCQPCGAVAT